MRTLAVFGDDRWRFSRSHAPTGYVGGGIGIAGRDSRWSL